MKKINKSPAPNKLTNYLQANPTDTWEDFRSHHSGIDYNNIKELIFDTDQGGLCAYCETKVNSSNPTKRRVEHIDEDYVRAAGLNPDDWKNIELYEAAGCDKCNNTGYKGRMAIHEALYFTKEIRQLIVRAGDDVDEESVRKQAKKDGTLTLRQSGLELVKLGLTSIQEVIGATMEE